MNNSFTGAEEVRAEGSAPRSTGGGKPFKKRPYRPGGSPYDQSAPRPKRVDEFAVTGTLPDYKDYERLRRYVSSQGKILPRRRSGLNAKHQRLMARAIKRARHLALLPIPGTLNK